MELRQGLWQLWDHSPPAEGTRERTACQVTSVGQSKPKQRKVRDELISSGVFRPDLGRRVCMGF